MKRLISISGFIFFYFLISNAQDIDLKKGLVTYYSFNGNANDESGNGNNATVHNATFVTDRNGQSNSAISFNGYNSYIQLPSGTSTSLNITSDFTSSIWFKTSDGANKGMIGCGDNYSGKGGFLIALGCANLGFGKVTVYTGNSWYSTNDAFADNKWHNVVVIVSSSLKIYVDNKLEYTNSNASSPNSWYGSRSLGSFNDGNGGYLNGCIDDFRIYNRVLNEVEIQALFNNGSYNENKPIVKNNNNSSTSAIDSYDMVTKISLNALSAEFLNIHEKNLIAIKLSSQKIVIYETNTWKQQQNVIINPTKNELLLSNSYYDNDNIYILISNTKGKKYIKYSLLVNTTEEVKCKTTPKGCLGESQYNNDSYRLLSVNKDNMEVNGFKVSISYDGIEIKKFNQEKFDYLNAYQHSSSNDFISFMNKYPNSSYKPKVIEALLSKANDISDCYLLCNKLNPICESAVDKAYSIALKGNKNDKKSYLTYFNNSKYSNIIQSQYDKLIEEEKDRQAKIDKEKEEQRLRDIQIQSDKEKAEKTEQERQAKEAKIEKENQAKKMTQINANSNRAVWKLGNKLCHDFNGSLIIGTLNQWNEDRSMAQIKIISSPGGKYKGDDISIGNNVWIESLTDGWHKCIDEELNSVSYQTPNTNTNQSNANLSNSSNSSAFNATDAGRFAKSFGKKFLSSCHDYGKAKNYSLKIDSWKEWKNGSGTDYLIFLTVSWSEIDGLTHLDYSYKGALIVDQFGCDGLFIISNKVEPSLFGLGGCVNGLDTKYTERMQSEIPGAKFYFRPEGCMAEE
jgi:hypothetical protein